MNKTFNITKSQLKKILREYNKSLRDVMVKYSKMSFDELVEAVHILKLEHKIKEYEKLNEQKKDISKTQKNMNRFINKINKDESNKNKDDTLKNKYDDIVSDYNKTKKIIKKPVKNKVDDLVDKSMSNIEKYNDEIKSFSNDLDYFINKKIPRVRQINTKNETLNKYNQNYNDVYRLIFKSILPTYISWTYTETSPYMYYIGNDRKYIDIKQLYKMGPRYDHWQYKDEYQTFFIPAEEISKDIIDNWNKAKQMLLNIKEKDKI